MIALTVSMNPQPKDRLLALIGLSARLGYQQHVPDHALACKPISENLVAGFPVHSIPEAPTSHQVNLTFFLTQLDVEAMESKRHEGHPDIIQLYLDIRPVVAAVETFNEQKYFNDVPESPWPTQYGLYAQVMPFWTARVDPVSIQIERSKWVRDILPGLGYDRARLLEVTFPPSLPDVPSAARAFDDARRALDDGRYDDSIAACRGILKMWEKHLAAQNKPGVRIADKLAQAQGWIDGDVRRNLIDTYWSRIIDTASAPHHPEGNPEIELFAAHDARLVLFVTAALSQYLADSTK
ncbi:MAG: hypothetical protein M0Z88_03050 [Actinomycetota bacterium]|nr:hypothetical protein [Actinomycetota bacterium]